MRRGFSKEGRRLFSGAFESALASGFFSVLLASLNLFLFFLLSDILDAGHHAAPWDISLWLMGGLLLFFLFVSVLSYWVVYIWVRCRRKELGFRLQARAVLIFTSVGIIPAAIVSGFSYMFFDYGVKEWYKESILPAFTKCTARILGQDRIYNDVVLKSDFAHLFKYLKTSKGNLHAKDIIRSAEIFDFSRILLVRNDEIIADSGDDENTAQILIEQMDLHEAKSPVVSVGETAVHIAQLLDDEAQTYLLAVRFVDQVPVGESSYNGKIPDYLRDIKHHLVVLQLQLSLAFLFLFLVILFVSVWLGVGFAEGILDSLSEIFSATKRVQEGDFDCEIECKKVRIGEEISTVVHAFNQMVVKLRKQRQQLTDAYSEINVRKSFVERVLSGVSSGVIALDSAQFVTLMNNRAMELLDCKEADRPLGEVFPEVTGLIMSTRSSGDVIITRGQRSLTLSVNVECLAADRGFIITFDDVSQLVEAQRKAAWSDIARKIAHEIKNPMTPIYLAAERISKKYADQIVTDRETFLRYADTIMKQVSCISSIIDEFVSFARMPRPTFKECNISAIIRSVSLLGQFGRNTVRYDLSLPEEDVMVWGDRERILQVFVNVFKNACESIDASQNAGSGYIKVVVTARETGGVTVDVRDNGVGFSESLVGKLTEPYVTTREHGTGLGLAIVKEILEEHGATISFRNSGEGGSVLVTFSK
ncbi:adaptive-response sensory-kinase SasA [Anaplasma platys]|uniref:Putative sensor histidine kinase NtrY-like n=1 Tax=Anaplasma platys TaxID=949 RepID=A0A858PXF5_9RICK|nr:ATP-binding protein [Anaplasma platys]QJC27260.1 adaptive-response sensory-kinase SasA [Anaplasma platys]